MIFPPMLTDVLTSLGLDDKERSIYLELLKRGPSRASVLSYHVNLPRTTVQNILLRLEREKLASKRIEKNVFIFAASDPENLLKIVDIKKRQETAKYERLRDDLQAIMPQMISMMQSNKNLPSVKFYRGRDAVRTILFDTLSSKTELKDFANIDAMFQYVKDINDEYVAAREKTMKTKRPITKRSLLLDTPFAHQVYESGRYSPKSHKGYKWIKSSLYPFALEMNIYDGKVSYITYVEDDFTGVIIENEHIYRMHDSMWNLIWDMSPVPVKKSKD